MDPFRPAGLAHRVGQRLEIVGAAEVVEIGVRPDNFPPFRCGQVDGMLGTQVVGVRLGSSGQRTDDRGRLGIGIGQRGDGRFGAPGP